MESTQFEIIECSLPKATKKDEDDWTLWEHKTLNIHRAIIHSSNKSNQTYSEISESIRSKIDEKFKMSWWRGFGYGAIIDVPTIPTDIEIIYDSIDTRDNKNGTWQWIILVCQESRSIIAVHTWMAGFLTPIYEALINSYHTEGYEVGTFKKEKN